MNKLMSLESIVAIKIAVFVCNTPDLKKEIMCAYHSDYYNYFSEHPYQQGSSSLQDEWKRILDEKQQDTLKQLPLPEAHQQQILNYMKPIKLRMLVWAKYIQAILGFSFLEQSVDCINSSLFNAWGNINAKEVALVLVENEKFEISQRYKLACLYCLEQPIRSLWEKIPEEEKEDFYHMDGPEELQQPALVNFWSYFLMDNVAMVTGDRDPRLYRFDKAIESGNKDAVKYCWDKLDPIEKEQRLVPSALAALSFRKESKNSVLSLLSDHDPDELFAEYYIDILSFLLSKMQDDQKSAFFKAAIRTTFRNAHQAKQDYCEDVKKLLLEFMPEKNRVSLCSDSPSSQLFFGTFFRQSRTLSVPDSASPVFTR